MRYVLGVALLLVICSCKEKKPVPANTSGQTDSSFAGKGTEKEDEYAEERRAQRLFERNDSLLHGITLNRAVAIAKENIRQSNFRFDFQTMPDTMPGANTNVRIGHFFSKKSRHVIVRSEGDFIHINIFLINGDSFQPVLYHSEWSMSHQNDTVQDINGDRYDDFVVNGYYVNGCCLRNFSNVYLFQAGPDTFTDSYNFINPTFSPSEHIIRGVEYGHRGETGIYKYKWNGLKPDTIEQIWHDEENPGLFKHWNKYASTLSRITLNEVPEEYRDIHGYDWFTGE